MMPSPLQAAQHYDGKNHAKKVRMFVSGGGKITKPPDNPNQATEVVDKVLLKGVTLEDKDGAVDPSKDVSVTLFFKHLNSVR